MNVRQLAEAIYRIQNSIDFDDKTNVIIKEGYIEVISTDLNEESFVSASIRASVHGLTLEVTREEKVD